jgi:radical SAM protein with 4Fe4S-binding SPASM domain
MLTRTLLKKVYSVGLRKSDATVGRLFDLEKTLQTMAARPYELHYELTNLCNADCIFCPYQFQERPAQFMSDEIFDKALQDYIDEGGGSVGLTPIVGDPLIDRKVLSRIRKLRSRPEIDRIIMTTNCIMADRYGADELIGSGITQLTVSIAGFDEAMYERVYRSKQYRRVRRNVLALLDANERAGKPVIIVIALRPDRALSETMAFPDFQKVLAFGPGVDFTWSYATAGGRITRELLPEAMRIRIPPAKTEPCVEIFNGPIVLADGVVMACSCVAAIDAVKDLAIGHIKEQSLGDIWRADRLRRLRNSFGTPALNPTCSKCDTYRNLEHYRTRGGRQRAAVSRRRATGEIVRRPRASGAWQGG